MFKTGIKGFIGGFFSLLVISILVFLGIYFLLPDLSVQYFGMTFNNGQYLEGKVDDYAKTLPEGTDDGLALYLSSGQAKEDLSSLLVSLGNDVKAFLSYLSSDEGKTMLKEKSSQARELAGDARSVAESGK